jgi:hypothetical protein
MEWLALANQLALSEKTPNEAITQLLTKKLIQFNPLSTQIIALTAEGVALADQLIMRMVGARVDDPLPDDLNGISWRTGRKGSLTVSHNRSGGIRFKQGSMR